MPRGIAVARAIRSTGLVSVARSIAIARGTIDGTTIIEDNFTDPDGTSLDAHAISPTNVPATTWVEILGNWQITSNRAVEAVTSSGGRARCNVGVSNVAIVATVISNPSAGGATKDAGVIGRWSSVTFWRVGINATDGLLRISEGVSQRATVAAPITPGTPYSLVVAFHGPVIYAVLNGTYQVSYSSATSNEFSTIFGIAGGSAGDGLDSFKVVV